MRKTRTEDVDVDNVEDVYLKVIWAGCERGDGYLHQGTWGGLAGRDDDGVGFKEGVTGFEKFLPRSLSSTNLVGIPQFAMPFS